MYKKHFPFFNQKKDNKKIIYFDSACSYIKNYRTIEWINDYYINYSWCSWDRQSSYLWSKLFLKVENTREKIKKFIWADKLDFVVFSSWTTDSINSIIYSLDETLIKNIITTDIEHNSNFLPQKEYSKEKCQKFHCFDYKDVINLANFEKKIKDIKWWFLFCVTHCSNITWYVFDIKYISQIVHKYGWYIFVDDAQYISNNTENVTENDIDFMAFSGHKIWWPTGIWVLYIKKSSANIIKHSNKIWWWTIQNIKNWNISYKKLPYFLEWGVQNYWWILWLSSCIDFIDDTWIDTIENYISELYNYFWQNFEKNNLDNYFERISIKWLKLITLSPKNFNCIDFHQYCNYFLEDFIISFRTWTMCCDNYVNNHNSWNTNLFRISFWIYNNKEDIDVFIKTLFDYINSL